MIDESGGILLPPRATGGRDCVTWCHSAGAIKAVRRQRLINKAIVTPCQEAKTGRGERETECCWRRETTKRQTVSRGRSVLEETLSQGKKKTTWKEFMWKQREVVEVCIYVNIRKYAFYSVGSSFSFPVWDTGHLAIMYSHGRQVKIRNIIIELLQLAKQAVLSPHGRERYGSLWFFSCLLGSTVE